MNMKRIAWILIVLIAISYTGCQWLNPVNSLTISITGSGTVDKNPDLLDYDEGSSVTLTAAPATGWVFSNWQGDATGTTNPITLSMNADKTIAAVFVEITYSVTVSITGSGIVDKDPDLLNYDEGSSVALTATPEAGWVFNNWEGDATGATNPVTLTMNEDKAVTAVFEALPDWFVWADIKQYNDIDFNQLMPMIWVVDRDLIDLNGIESFDDLHDNATILTNFKSAAVSSAQITLNDIPYIFYPDFGVYSYSGDPITIDAGEQISLVVKDAEEQILLNETVLMPGLPNISSTEDYNQRGFYSADLDYILQVRDRSVTWQAITPLPDYFRMLFDVDLVFTNTTGGTSSSSRGSYTQNPTVSSVTTADAILTDQLLDLNISYVSSNLDSFGTLQSATADISDLYVGSVNSVEIGGTKPSEGSWIEVINISAKYP
jgi:hypothetical protein